jgi:peptidoglycan/xylan/chitin deacetylase (PgdA/CDA1 family)
MDIDRHTEYDKQWTDHDKKVCVLLYHRVCDLPLDIWGLAISPEVFERHIRFYKENYNILRFDEDWSNVQEPSLVLTFDDGYADNLHYALPILEKYQVPATIFVSSGNIGTDKEFWWDELERIIFYNNKNEYYFGPNGEYFPLTTNREKETACQRIRLFLKNLLPEERDEFLKGMMGELDADRLPRPINRSVNEKELRKLASSPYITIGGHTVTHNMLSAESKEQQEWEIITSKARIEDIIDNEITVFSYPFGGCDDINGHSIESVKKAGYKKAATTSVGLVGKGIELYTIPRNSMPFYQEARDLKKQLRKMYTLL